FDCVGILYPQPQVFSRVLRRARSDRVAAHQMREIGSEASVRDRATDCMTVDARRCLEYAPTGSDRVVLNRGQLLCADPRIEVFGRVDPNTLQHLRVLQATVLRALSDEHAGA